MGFYELWKYHEMRRIIGTTEASQKYWKSSILMENALSGTESNDLDVIVFFF